VLRRTGLAAAYSVLIFAILLGYTLITNRKTKATEAVNA
jgi:ABC-type sugar transport system permease subunit